jgi:hypothetical protein
MLRKFFSRLRNMKSEVNKKNGAKPDPYHALRARLIERGTNLWRWAELRGYPYTTVVGAARGDRAGIKSVKILRELEEFTNA